MSSRKYNLDEAFFDNWSPIMAYILGFWFADGYMRIKKSYRISFSSNDLQIISDIRSAFKSNTLIVDYDRDRSFYLQFNSKRLYSNLIALGGFKRKSKTISFPDMPNMYLRDFVRGYFDGDGSVFFTEYTRTKDGRRTRELRTNFTSGSSKFLEDIMRVLNQEINLPIKKLGIYNNGSSLKLGYGMRDSDKLLNYMYYRSFPIGLNRKAAFLKKIPDYQKHTIVRT